MLLLGQDVICPYCDEEIWVEAPVNSGRVVKCGECDNEIWAYVVTYGLDTRSLNVTVETIEYS